MAESGRESRRWPGHWTLPYLPHHPSAPPTHPSPSHPEPQPSLHTPTQAAGGRSGTWHGEGLGESVESRAPGDLPGRDVGQHEAQLVQQVPQLAGSEGEKAGKRGESLTAVGSTEPSEPWGRPTACWSGGPVKLIPHPLSVDLAQSTCYQRNRSTGTLAT